MSNNKKAKLRDLNEKQFHDVLVELLPKMGAKKVRLNHGRDEHGKDIVFYKEDAFGRRYYAIVAKVGDISGSASGSKNLTRILRTIKEQIENAFDMPYQDITADEAKRFQINEVIVWTTGKISGNAQEKIIENLKTWYRNVNFRDGDDTLDLLEKHLPSYFDIGDAYIADYFEKAEAKYNSIEDLHSLGSLGTSRTLPTIFVDPKLEIMSRNRSKQANQLQRKTITFNRLTSMRSNTAIFGEMGSGKSTLLRKILLTTITKNQQNMSEFPIPVLLNFKNLNLHNAQPLDVGKEQVIEEAIQSEINSISGNNYQRNMEDDLNDGKMIVMIDGLDELNSLDLRKRVMEVTKSFSAKYPKCRIIITSRIELLNQTQFFTGFRLYKLNEFNTEQIKQLVVNWFGENTSDSRKLLNLINKPLMTIHSIPNTPIALTLVAVLYERGHQDLPSNLTELLKKYVELALDRWDLTKKIKAQIEWAYKEQVLQKLSWQMLSKGKYEISNNDFEDHTEQYKYDRALNFQTGTLVKEILDRSGLLVKNENGLLEFKHRVFLDYFCGKELNDQRDVTRIIVEKFGEPNWSRVIFFACGLQPGNDAYLEAIMAKEKSEAVDTFSYAIHLGLVAQAAYLVKRDTKHQIVRKTLSTFVNGWNSLADDFLDIISTSDTNYWPYPFVVLFYSLIVRDYVGSSTLAPALEEITDVVFEKMELILNLSDSKKQNIELLAFSLAVACANAGNIEYFVKIFQSNLITNPVYALIGDIDTRELLRQEALTEPQRKLLSQLSKKLKRKISNNNSFLRKAMKSEPILLEANNSEIWDDNFNLMLESGEVDSKLCQESTRQS